MCNQQCFDGDMPKTTSVWWMENVFSPHSFLEMLDSKRYGKHNTQIRISQIKKCWTLIIAW